MRSFDYKSLYKKLLTPETVSYLAQIHEQKGQQNVLIAAHQNDLGELMEIAKIQSVEASNRMECVITTDDRLKRLVRNKTTPRNRGEREIAGYRDVLTTIRENYDYIPIRPGSILQLHQELYKFSNAASGGSFKHGESAMDETPEAMEALCRAYADALKTPDIDPLLLIPVFILDFLCIHPFQDGNGRMSRLLTLLLLYRSGYIVGKYISLEKLISDSKESYYEALQESSADWHEGANDYLPFVRYLLGIIVAAYRDFSARAETAAARGLSKPSRVREIIRAATGRITKAQIMVQCPDISQVTVERALRDMLDKGEILKISGGRYTSYTWNWEAENK